MADAGADAGGIANAGNTCYLNTTLQCLGHCPVFLKYMLKDEHSGNNNLASQMHEVYVELFKNKNHLLPKKFLGYLQNTIKFIEIYEQNDLSEFVSLLIDKLNQCLGKPLTVTKEHLIRKYKYTTSDFDVQRFKMDTSWYEKNGKEYSALVPMFHGQLISQIVCGSCGKIFHNYEIYLNLMLPITDKTETLYDCLDEYFSDETINKDDGIWTCDGCHQKAASQKTTRLWRNPSILIVSLKRFTHDLRKNNKRIEVPEVLDLSKYALTKNTNMYKLNAVAHHFGSNQSGHYFAMCKSGSGDWYNFDDLSINKVDKPSHVHGYVFFYSRESS